MKEWNFNNHYEVHFYFFFLFFPCACCLGTILLVFSSNREATGDHAKPAQPLEHR